MEEKVKNILAMVGLEEAGSKYPAELSGGMKKRAALARSVIMDSKILLCDEPTSGLDPIKSREISDLIKNITQQLECTTVVTSHDIYNASRIADRLVLIHDGKILIKGKPEELKSSNNSLVRDFFA
jgi:phospholipid/cholesterol/gamma-HCH transport system ATP-binding protein